MKNQYSLNTVTTAVVLVLVTFTCLIAYKYIASDVDEKRQKAVIEERVRSENALQEERNFCIQKAENEKGLKVAWYSNDFKGKYGENWREYVPANQAYIDLVKEAEQAAQQAKDNCYKQFK